MMEDSSSVAMPPASNSSVAKMQAALLETLTESHTRTEVDACMSVMLLDIETTFNLQQQIALHSNQDQVDRLAKEQRATIIEADAERVAREEERMELADHFVKELLTLSQEMEMLLQWKKEHEDKINSYDEILAKLVQAEEELESANRVSYGGAPKARQPETLERGSSFSATEEKAREGAASHVVDGPADDRPVEVRERKEPNVLADDENDDDDAAAESPEESGAAIGKEESSSNEDRKPTAKSTTAPIVEEQTPEEETTTTENAAPVAAVVLEEEEENDVPNFAEIDMEILMSIFGYLDAVDILNTAQISIAMYTRVDSIFGIAEDGHAMPQPTPQHPPSPAPPKASAPGGAVKAPPPPAMAQYNPPPPAAAAGDTGGGMGLFSSILQPRAPTARNNPPPPAKAAPGRSQPMNGNLAKSMASKLSDAELAAIISMTDKLGKLDKEVNLLRNEKEALTAKLDGTEAVKKFLINKVRDVEIKLKHREDEDVKITKQVSSDQEVIAFLDSQVQELERNTEEVTTERALVQTELDSLKSSASKKAIMLNDMLKYEREKLREEESEWKATKKVLVKEVKSCRAQILALQAERDGFKEQNEMLKRAIVSTGKNHASPIK